jgi:oligosaccharide repeat unit polymerase
MISKTNSITEARTNGKLFNPFWIISFLSLAVILCLALSFLKNSFLFLYGMAIYFFIFYSIFHSRKNYLSPFLLFNVFFFALFGLGPFILYLQGFDYYQRIGLFFLISWFLFLLGYSIAEVIVKKRRIVRPTTSKARYDYKNLFAISLLFFIVGAFANVYYLASNFSLIFGENLESGRVEAMTGNGLLLWLGRLMWLGVFVSCESTLRSRYHKVRTALMLVLASILSILVGFRSVFADAFLVILLMFNKFHKMSFRQIIIIVLFLLVFVLIYGAIRSESMTMIDVLINEMKVSSSNLNSILQAFPSSIDFQYGRTYFFDISALFDDNSSGFTMWLKEQLGLYFSGGGVTPTLMGEFYINWNWAGLSIGILATGIGCFFLNRAYLNPPSRNLFIVALLSSYIRSVLRGGVGNCIALITVYIVGYYLILFFAKKKQLVSQH